MQCSGVDTIILFDAILCVDAMLGCLCIVQFLAAMSSSRSDNVTQSIRPSFRSFVRSCFRPCPFFGICVNQPNRSRILTKQFYQY